MILHSGTGRRDVVAAAFPEEDVVDVGSPEALRDALDEGEQSLLVVDPNEIGVEVVDDLLDRADRTVPTVLVSDAPAETDLEFDAVVDRDPTVEDLRSAADRARRVAAYRESVGDFYERSRGRSPGEFDPDLLDSRREADRRFEELPPLDETTIDALLRDRSEE